jgi:hypothetical protein
MKIMRMNLPCGTGPSIEDIRNVCDALKLTRADYVQAFSLGEDGPFARQELAQLQSIIMAFDAVIGETDRLGASTAPEGKLEAAIEDIKRVAAAREAGLI